MRWRQSDQQKKVIETQMKFWKIYRIFRRWKRFELNISCVQINYFLKTFKNKLFVQGKLKNEGDARIIELKMKLRADVLLTLYPSQIPLLVV